MKKINLGTVETLTEKIITHEIKECDKCCGQGYIAGFHHIAEGICFKCNGTGKLKTPFKYEQTVTEVTEVNSLDAYILDENTDFMELVKHHENKKQHNKEVNQKFENDEIDFFELLDKTID